MRRTSGPGKDVGLAQQVEGYGCEVPAGALDLGEVVHDDRGGHDDPALQVMTRTRW